MTILSSINNITYYDKSYTRPIRVIMDQALNTYIYTIWCFIYLSTKATWPQRGWYVSTWYYHHVSKNLRHFSMFYATLSDRHRSCIIFHREDLLSGQNDSSAQEHMQIHIHNHAWTQLNANTNAFQGILFTQIQIHIYNNSCQKKCWAALLSDLESDLSPRPQPVTRRDKLERVAQLQLCER